MEEKIYVCIFLLIIKSNKYYAAPMVTPTPTLPSVILPVSRSTPLPIPAHMDVNEVGIPDRQGGGVPVRQPAGISVGNDGHHENMQMGEGWGLKDSTVTVSTPSISASAAFKCCALCKTMAKDTGMYSYNKVMKKCYCRKIKPGIIPQTTARKNAFSGHCPDDQKYQKHDRRMNEAGDYAEEKPQERFGIGAFIDGVVSGVNPEWKTCRCNYQTDRGGDGICNYPDKGGLYCYVNEGTCTDQHKSALAGLFYSYIACFSPGCACNGQKDSYGNGLCNYKHNGKVYCFADRDACIDETVTDAGNAWSYNACQLRRCTGEDNGCCTTSKPCARNEGDCDKSSQCLGGLICGTNNCWWGDGDDCCENGPLAGVSYGYATRDIGGNLGGSNNASTNAVSYKVSSNGRAARKYSKLMGVYFANGKSINNFPIYENKEHQFMYVDIGGWWKIGPDVGSPASYIHNPRRSVTEEPPVVGWQYANKKWYKDPTLKVIAV